jgi:hypothetical protein
LLEEDFFFIKPVDLALLAKIEAFCQEHNVDRFSLQSKHGYSFSDWPKTGLTIDDLPVYQADQRVGISFALEASIWKRSFLLDNLKVGLSDSQIEVWVSNAIRQNSQVIYALDQPVMDYRDAVRGGKTVITLHDDPLRLVAEPGHSRALYPIGEGSETLLL